MTLIATSGSSQICRRCGSSDLTQEYQLQWKDDRFDSYSVQSCGNCSIAFADPFPTVAELEALYASIEYHDEDRQAGNFWEMDQAQIQHQVECERGFYKKYSSYFPSKGPMFDVGAGWGTLAKYFQLQGWDASGMEISSTETEFAKEKLDLTIHNLPIEQIDEIALRDCQLVTMRHVLEHFADPVSALSSLHKMLANGGRLIIEVPDYGSWDRRHLGEQWPAFGPYHLWYFSRISLSALLSDCGFRILTFETFLSSQVFGAPNAVSRTLRRVANRVGAKRWFSGRTIGLVAEKITH